MEFREGTLVCGRYEILKGLGSSAFGDVFSGFDREKHTLVTIKVEESDGFDTSLEWEHHIYSCLLSRYHPLGVPRPISFDTFYGYDILVLPLLGGSLRDIWKHNGPFPLKSICKIGIQLVNRLEHIHNNGFLHLDVRPENIMVGKGDDFNTVYLVDFGLAKSYEDYNEMQLPGTGKASFNETNAFSSVYIGLERENSRRDDIESMMYCLHILHKGWLPWCYGDWHDDRNCAANAEDVKWYSRNMLFSDMPRQLWRAWNIVRLMDFEEKPRYHRLRELFREVEETSCENDLLHLGLG